MVLTNTHITTKIYKYNYCWLFYTSLLKSIQSKIYLYHCDQETKSFFVMFLFILILWDEDHIKLLLDQNHVSHIIIPDNIIQDLYISPYSSHPTISISDLATRKLNTTYSYISIDKLHANTSDLELYMHKHKTK